MISGSFEGLQTRMMPNQCKRRAQNKPHPFSIVAILGEDFFKNEKSHLNENKKAEERLQDVLENEPNEVHDAEALSNSPIRFGWLDCTRYKPPKVPRSKRKRGATARPSRQPRVPFTPFQQATLENKFQIDHYLTSSAVNELSLVLNLPEQRIKIWFQNRRARERRESQQKTEMSPESLTP